MIDDLTSNEWKAFQAWATSSASKIPAGTAWDSDTVQSHWEAWKAAGSIKDTEISALRFAMTVPLISEKMMKSMFNAIQTDTKAVRFDALNWYTAGATCAEEWHKLYVDTVMAQRVQPTKDMK